MPVGAVCAYGEQESGIRARDMHPPGSIRCDVGVHIAWRGRMKNMSSNVVVQVGEQRGAPGLPLP